MLALVIILAIIVFIELIVCFAIHFNRKKTHEVYMFMADMVSQEGGALQKALEELKDSSTYAQPAESAAAIGEIIRFLDSFNATVRKQAERIEEAQKHKWHAPITGLFARKKKTEYTPPSKKKSPVKTEETKEEKEEAETKDEELEKIEEKIEKKLAEEEPKPKKLKKLKRRIKKYKQKRLL